MMKKSKAEEVLSDKLSQITRSARVLQSPSCLGDGRLEVYRSGGGKRRVWERAVGRKAITLQSAGPWKVNGLLLLSGSCDQQPRLDNGWALQAPRMATSWAVTRAHGGLTRLGAG